MWERIFKALSLESDNEYAMNSAGAKKGGLKKTKTKPSDEAGEV